MDKISIPDAFPNLPASVQKIQKMFASNTIEIPTLVALLESEPLLSANILKLVNSPYYGLGTKVSSINGAVMLLGTTVIRGIIMATILKKSFPLDLSVYGISVEQFETISILRAKLLKEWLQGTGVDIQLLSLAAFLMESGKIVMAHEIVKNNLKVEFVSLCQIKSQKEAEMEIFGVQSYGVASALFSQWQFDDAFCTLVGSVGNPQSNDAKILHALQIVINTRNIFDADDIAKAKEFLDEHELHGDAFLRSIEKIKKI